MIPYNCKGHNAGRINSCDKLVRLLPNAGSQRLCQGMSRVMRLSHHVTAVVTTFQQLRWRHFLNGRYYLMTSLSNLRAPIGWLVTVAPEYDVLRKYIFEILSTTSGAICFVMAHWKTSLIRTKMTELSANISQNRRRISRKNSGQKCRASELRDKTQHRRRDSEIGFLPSFPSFLTRPRSSRWKVHDRPPETRATIGRLNSDFSSAGN